MELEAMLNTDSEHVIETSGLTKDYGFGRGVFDVNIHVDKGEVFGFLGPNGAGKRDVVTLCLCATSMDGKITLKEKSYIRRLWEALE